MLEIEGEKEREKGGRRSRGRKGGKEGKEGKRMKMVSPRNNLGIVICL